MVPQGGRVKTVLPGTREHRRPLCNWVPCGEGQKAVSLGSKAIPFVSKETPGHPHLCLSGEWVKSRWAAWQVQWERVAEDGPFVSGGWAGCVRGQRAGRKPAAHPSLCLCRPWWAETASSPPSCWGERNSTQFLNWKGEEKAKVVNC